MRYDEALQAVRGGSDPTDVARAFVAELTDDEKLGCLDGDVPTWAGLRFMTGQDGYHRMTFPAAQVDRVGLPGIHFADGPRGCVVGNATAFPVAMARGATWDPALEERIGDAIGAELRAAGATFTGAVCVNLLRHPAWGRAQETYGEDPHHVGEMGAAFTRGLQRHVLACVKHFACNSMENARFQVDIEVDEAALHEQYLPHFKRIVDEGVASVMSAYNAVNGEWCGQHPGLLTDILRDEWGFAGFVISDFIFGLRDAASSLTAGLDIEMPFRQVRARDLGEALENGDATWAHVDLAVERIVSTLLRFDDVLSAPAPSPGVIGSSDHRALAREVAARSAVLLRNEPVDDASVLPLDPGVSVAVIGRLGDVVNLGDGGSSDVWDLEATSVADGLRHTFPTVTVDDGSDLERARAVAADADVAVVVVGYTYRDEGEYIGATSPELTTLFPETDDPDEVAAFEAYLASMPEAVKPPHHEDRALGFMEGGDRERLQLLDEDVACIRAVSEANPKTIVVLQAGSAVVVDEWIDAVPAVVQSFYGGCEAGAGLADVLTGVVNPSARLPFSVPVSADDLPTFDRDATSFTYDPWFGWWHLARSGTDPAFPFGFGLGYTTFELTRSSVVVEEDGDRIIVDVDVVNTGDRRGADVVQVYAELADADSPPRLVGFGRVEIEAGASATLAIDVPLQRMATRDTEHHTWIAPRGTHRISIARHATDPARRTHDVSLTDDVGLGRA